MAQFSLRGIFSSASLRGKLVRDFLLSVGLPILIVGVLLVFVVYSMQRSQVESYVSDIDSFVQSLLVEQERVLKTVLEQHLLRVEASLKDEFARAEYREALTRLALAPNEARQKLSAAVTDAMRRHKLSMLTLVSPSGVVIVRATDPNRFGDSTFAFDYDKAVRPAAPLRRFLETALQGNTITSFELYPVEVLKLEAVNAFNVIENVTIAGKNSLADQARVDGTKSDPKSWRS
jgi:hypothetical protein